jgi:RNA polymerase sigma-70 factor (ECF subfamily)
LSRALTKTSLSAPAQEQGFQPGMRVGSEDGGGLKMKTLYLQYHEELRSAMMSKFDMGRSEAEDVVQTAFIRLAECKVGIDNPRAFLHKTCSNIVIDQIRRRQVQNNYAKAMIDSDGGEGTVLGPEREVESRQRLSIISKAMWMMPGRRRKLLMMSRFDGLSYAEIGRRVNLSESAVRKHINNAMADCQKALQSPTT